MSASSRMTVQKRMDYDRRRFLGSAAMTIAAAHAGIFGAADAEGASRELAALGRAAEWLNSPRLTPAGLAGKVVLVDFCTYTCINWLRTLPYIRAWAQKYQAGTGRDRRAHARVRIRTEPRQRPPRRAADEDRLPDRDRQRLRDLARVQTTNTGLRSTSSMRGDAFASTTSARASTNGPRRSSNGC